MCVLIRMETAEAALRRWGEKARAGSREPSESLLNLTLRRTLTTEWKVQIEKVDEGPCSGRNFRLAIVTGSVTMAMLYVPSHT